ncbi:uncharacterized membrane protein HdeD (DUF308 family) [Hasllibacter halocynthiae]|uniref:Uncharacterized membrane protein HdeD (DUF308 family) n=1 Tax=Hasllibacter halocynthiae TaxID=595589 RepID=A0A2T0X224_9RHOB|nr:HdeD family acid-resistance protein [Hasllibacter halocynthiae]PRY92914.1 uncharacterized membrane protein HdeD (DUF308 family) [Hasllibacter halocynthiae]
MSDRDKPTNLPPRRPGEDVEPGPPVGAAEGGAMPAGGGGGVVAPAGSGPATGRKAPAGEGDVEPTADEAAPGVAGPGGGAPARDGEGRPVTDADGPLRDAGGDRRIAPAEEAHDAGPSHAEMARVEARTPAAAIPAVNRAEGTRPDVDPAPGADPYADPYVATGTAVPGGAGGGAGFANPYGRAADAPVWPLWVMGGVALVAGLVALFMPFVATLAATTLAAAMLLVSGIAGLVGAFRMNDGWAIVAGVIVSILSVVGAVLMLFIPLAGFLAVTTVIIAFFAASGATKLWYGIRNGEGMPGRGWMIASGAISLVLALLLLLQLPVAALWLPGLLLAVDLAMYGATMLAVAWQLSRLKDAAA